MELRLFNTLTRQKQQFFPIDPQKVRLYCCGPTVYDRAHVGNARPVVVFDVLFRLLRHFYGSQHVIYVRNITDIDDRIIEAAHNNNESITALTARTARAYQLDMAALGTLPPTHEPRATEYIQPMVEMITGLVDKGCAYENQGHVLFHVPADPDYGCLSKRPFDEMIAGARVEVAPYKKHPADFVLWKPSSQEQPGWDSPWGRGRPGWHIECSAMAGALLGEVFDIHGGGLDLIFPHHENEIAQSRCAHHGQAPVRYWIHNGFVQVNSEKMSKSKGNFFTVRQLLDQGYAGETIRLNLLTAHYRQPLDISSASLHDSKQQLDKFYLSLQDMPYNTPVNAAIPAEFFEIVGDDLNIPLAITWIHDQVNAIHKAKNSAQKLLLQVQLKHAASLLGILQQSSANWLQQIGQVGNINSLNADDIERFIQERRQARLAKDFKKADHIRQHLEDKGIILEDNPAGTRWRRI